ncbi:MAG TPA: exodeoxyribonuclease V subunit gamma [Syntrophorhabdaceae bacterium]|nr:exodeoxyribonuclease V subunit gamma [Syntrophorhabdaceae bacterium]
MTGFKLYTGNRLELLVDALSEVVKTPLASPFSSEIIVVQSKGMERWLSIELSKRFGVWANCRYPFPDNFVWGIFSALQHNLSDTSIFSPRVMTWRIMGMLPEYIGTHDFDILRQYLEEDKNQLKMLQLSERIADTFDKYTVYRPDMLMDWEKGNGTGWQPVLWRALIKDCEQNNRTTVWRNFLKSVENGTCDKKLLPERICVFGIPSMPNYHFLVIQALSNLIDVHFFLMNPTSEYWGDIVTEKQRIRFSDNAHFETGNPLLASMGKLGREFFDTIISFEYEDFHLFIEPKENSTLSYIQSDIYHLNWRGRDTEKTPIHTDDISVQFHSCHSPMREIEVLYDNLLFLFEKYSDLEPKDILVMTPDITTYAPYISAVFDNPQDERNKIPYSIADRGAPSENPIIDVFLKIIKLCKGRFIASEVIDVLDANCVQERFNINTEDFDTIIKWIKDTHIRWGIDGSHRQDLMIPPFEANSWRKGIESLLLGYAMFSKEHELFQGIPPYNDIEGNETVTLGHLLDFLSSLFFFADTFKTVKSLSEWETLLEKLLAQFIAVNDDSERDIQLIRDELRMLGSLQKDANFDSDVSIDVIIYHLTKNLNSMKLSTGFITGGVTFCEMLPMRSVPFKVVGLIGMNNDTYPREHKTTGFDLTSHNPRPGDRSLRDEDRYLFLEAILSARLCLYISYIGQSIRDNSNIPPSVLVSELFDYIENAFLVEEGDIADFILKKHRLQAFSPLYFKEGHLFSYSKEDCEALRAGIKKTYTPSPFISVSIEDTTSEWKNITINDLKRFYRNPSKYFLNYRFGVYLEEDSFTTEDDEPFVLDNLSSFSITTEITDALLSGKNVSTLKKAFKAGGILPPEAPGEVALRKTFLTAKSFSDKLKGYNIEEKPKQLDIDINLAGFRISGRLGNIYQPGIINYRCVKSTKAKYLLETWIDHLVLNTVQDESIPHNSMFITINHTYTFKPLESGIDTLVKLLEIFYMGIKEPIKFFPQTSNKYAEQIMKGKNTDEALKSAINEWYGTEFSTDKESEDAYFKLCFGKIDPLDEIFRDIAMNIYAPILTNMRRT